MLTHNFGAPDVRTGLVLENESPGLGAGVHRGGGVAAQPAPIIVLKSVGVGEGTGNRHGLQSEHGIQLGIGREHVAHLVQLVTPRAFGCINENIIIIYIKKLVTP